VCFNSKSAWQLSECTVVLFFSIIPHSRHYGLTFTAIHKQPFPLPHYCGISILSNVASAGRTHAQWWECDTSAWQCNPTQCMSGIWGIAHVSHCNYRTIHPVGVTAVILGKLPLPQLGCDVSSSWMDFNARARFLSRQNFGAHAKMRHMVSLS
jgi:hypothetical protein